MSGEILVPSVGESITEVVISRWLVPVGTFVAVDTPVVALETDKASVEVPAPIQGYLRSVAKEEDDVAEVGAVLGVIEAAEAPAGVDSDAADATPAKPAKNKKAADAPVMPAAARVLGEAGVSADQVEGSGRGGRVTKADALAAVKGKKSAPAAKAPAISPAKPAVGNRSEEVVPMTRMRRTIARRLRAPAQLR